ncbi:MAG: aldehyde dehydrogenase family protein, partial [Rhodobacteraceae bacterium]|nr:aldehyde dehydrogenase family protein [Paracoccaceae bacterium]
GRVAGHVGAGNRKDIRNAVEAARAAQPRWAAMGGAGRAQVLHFLAENLSARGAEFAARLDAFSGRGDGEHEVSAAVERLMLWGGRADRHGGDVVSAPGSDLVVSLNAAVGVIGILCPDEAPLLGLVSVLAPALAFGNAVVAVPSCVAPLVATDFWQVCDTSDIPAGVLNLVTGDAATLAPHLAGHLGVDAIWCFGAAPLSGLVEEEAAGNLKRSLVNDGRGRDWAARGEGACLDFVAHATEVQTIWMPQGM